MKLCLVNKVHCITEGAIFLSSILAVLLSFICSALQKSMNERTFDTLQWNLNNPATFGPGLLGRNNEMAAVQCYLNKAVCTLMT